MLFSIKALALLDCFNWSFFVFLACHKPQLDGFWSTFSSHCPLSSYQWHWKTSATSIIFPLNFFGNGGNQTQCWVWSKQPNQLFSIQFFLINVWAQGSPVVCQLLIRFHIAQRTSCLQRAWLRIPNWFKRKEWKKLAGGIRTHDLLITILTGWLPTAVPQPA